jgi:hypothetical protein
MATVQNLQFVPFTPQPSVRRTPWPARDKHSVDYILGQRERKTPALSLNFRGQAGINRKAAASVKGTQAQNA